MAGFLFCVAGLLFCVAALMYRRPVPYISLGMMCFCIGFLMLSISSIWQ